MVPGGEFAVSGQADVVKVLLLSENGKIKIGKPYLKETLNLKILEQFKGPKVRVAKYHAKANYRRVKGYRSKLTKVILDVKKDY